MSLQDILGQLPLLKSYTHILLCFSLPDSEREPVLESLQCATQRLLAAFPFLTGRVVHKNIRPGHSGTFTVEAYGTDNESTTTTTEKVKEILVIKDLSHILPPYSTLYAAQAPPSMLPGSIVAPPRPAFPRVYTDDPAPVLEIQASLVKGGLLLDLAAQHNIIDATGIFYIAYLLSRLIDKPQTNPIPHADVLLGNCDRQHLIPLLASDEALPKEMDVFTKERPPPLDRETLAEFKWYLLHFPPDAITSIHGEAMSHPEDFVDGITSVSTNDALTAFCWQRITLVRSSIPSKPATTHTHAQPQDHDGKGKQGSQTTTQITRAADLRRTMNLSPAYMGHMVRTANLRLPTSTVTSSSLSALSSRLRLCVSEHTSPHSVRGYASLLARETDKTRILYAAGFNPRTDFSCSSVAHVALPRFGKELGVPDYVRRPTFGPLPSGMYIGPGRKGEGGLDAMVCLREREMYALRNDGGWSARVKFVG